MRAKIAIIVGLCGAFLSGGVGVVLGLEPREAVKLAAVAGVAALATGIAGALVLRLLRGQSIERQAAAVSLTAVTAVAAGAGAAARAMFLSDHQFTALATVLISAGTVAVLVSILLGVRIDADREALVEATRRIGEGEPHPGIDDAGTAEFASLAKELDAMSTQLEKARERERALDSSRRDLVAWISHDLRTPIARIRAIVEALDDDLVADPDTAREYHRTLNAEAIRLTSLINDLFALSRISAGSLELELEQISLADLVSDVVASARPLAKARGLTFSLAIEARPTVRLSVSHIERALGNLLDNAIRHTASDHSIGVGITAVEGMAEVTVSDGCGGITSAELERILAPTTHRRSPHDPSSQAGLGLVIARGMAAAHDGSIDVKNRHPGCLFTIRLPLAGPDSDDGQRPPHEQPPARADDDQPAAGESGPGSNR